MKKLIRSYLIAFISFYTIVQLIPGLHYGDRLDNLLVASLFFALLASFVAPIIKIILLPFNMLTFGGISALINFGIIFLLTFLLPFFTIQAFTFTGLTLFGFVIPEFNSSPLVTIIFAGGGIGICSGMLTYLFS